MSLRRFLSRNSDRARRPGSTSVSSNTSTVATLDPAAESFREAGDRMIAQGDFASSISFYSEAIRLAPADVQLRVARAIAYKLSGPMHYDLALNDANTAIQCQPTDWRAWDVKGDISVAMTDYLEAEDAYQTALGFATAMDRPRIISNLAGVRVKRLADAPSDSSASLVATVLTVPEQTASASVITRTQRETRQSTTDQLPTFVPDRPNPQASQSTAVFQPESRSAPIPSMLETLGENVPTAPPPVYSATPTTSNTVISSVQPASSTDNTSALESALVDLILRALPLTSVSSNPMSSRDRGRLSLRTYVAGREVDAIQLVYVGLTQSQLTTRELDIGPKSIHDSHNSQIIDSLSFPGTNFLDKDCEVSALYAGSTPGTVTVSGYTLEYRLAQLAQETDLQLESLRLGLPENDLVDIVSRLQSFKLEQEDNEGLKLFLKMSQLHTLQCGFGPEGLLQKRIDNICYMITRTRFDEPLRVRDFSAVGPLSSFLVQSTAQPKQLQNFLFQLMLGLEVLLRVRQQKTWPSYYSIITYNISCMMVAAHQFKNNVRIVHKPPTSPASVVFSFIPLKHNAHAEGLVQFATAIKWPLLAESKRFIYQATSNIALGTWPSGPYLRDVLFGLVLPGKHFRHTMLCALIEATPSVTALGTAPYYASGLVLDQKASYWPQQTVLGRVLGGLPNMASCCGWIGPGPSSRRTDPGSGVNGWVRISSEPIVIPTPVTGSLTTLSAPRSTDPSDWIIPTPPMRKPGHQGSIFKHLNLDLIRTDRILSTLPSTLTGGQQIYRASLDFEINSTPARFTLFKDALFVTAPPCVGTHFLLKTEALRWHGDTVTVSDLPHTMPEPAKILIINALGEGDEAVARAWCAQHGKNAIVRRGGVGAECCLACACTLADSRIGLGFHVVIWSL